MSREFLVDLLARMDAGTWIPPAGEPLERQRAFALAELAQLDATTHPATEEAA